MSTSASPEALLSAWKVMRQRDCLRHWPQDFAQVMADPVRYRLVSLEAKHPCRAPMHPVERRIASLRMPFTPPFFDHKRAAAGDRDD